MQIFIGYHIGYYNISLHDSIIKHNFTKKTFYKVLKEHIDLTFENAYREFLFKVFSF